MDTCMDSVPTNTQHYPGDTKLAYYIMNIGPTSLLLHDCLSCWSFTVYAHIIIASRDTYSFSLLIQLFAYISLHFSFNMIITLRPLLF